MTKRRAEKLTGCEIRRIEGGKSGLVCLEAFADGRLAERAEHKYEEVAIELLVKKIYLRNCRDALIKTGWRCARCHGSGNLQIHHRQYRSHGGTHQSENLEPVCWKCHRLIHKYEKSKL